MSIKAVTYYEAHCDGCGWTTADFGDDYTAWSDQGGAIDNAVNFDWFHRTDPERLLCPKCQKCEVCGARGYEVDGHMVCEDHEDHEFDTYCWSYGPRIGDDGRPVCFQEQGHTGPHRAHPDAGFSEVLWHNPALTVPVYQRSLFWTPTKGTS